MTSKSLQKPDVKARNGKSGRNNNNGHGVVVVGGGGGVSEELYTLEPPDGQYGWVALFGVCLASIMTVTIFESLSVILNDLILLFDTTTATISWMPAIVVSGGQLFGPVATALVNSYGYRKTAFLGGILAASGMIFSYFATRVTTLLLIISLSGPGIQLCVTAYTVILSKYFKKYFAIAIGIMNAAFGGGKLLIVPLTQLVLSEYGCRAVFLIMGVNMLNICVGASLFQPVKKHMKSVRKEELSPMSKTTEEKIPLYEEDDNDNKLDKPPEYIKLILPPPNDDVSDMQKRVRLNSIHLCSSWDIFGSMTKLSKHSAKQSNNDNNDGGCNRGICQTIDHSLWKEPEFYMICFNNFLVLNLMLYAPFYLYPLGIEIGLTPVETASVVSSKGIAEVLGRLFGPVFITMFGLSNKVVYFLVGLIHSVLLAAIIFADTFSTFMSLGIISGLALGVVSTLVQVLIVECLGAERLSSVIGLGSFIQAFFALPMPPLMGFIRDTSGSFINVYLFLAAIQILICIIWIPKIFFHKKTTN